MFSSFRKKRGKPIKDTFSRIKQHPFDKLLSLLRRVIFQDRKNRNREDEGIFRGEETRAYRGRNSNDPSNAPADVQTRIVRGIRRPAKSVPIIYKDNKTRGNRRIPIPSKVGPAFVPRFYAR